jgi:hypothetical protein
MPDTFPIAAPRPSGVWHALTRPSYKHRLFAAVDRWLRGFASARPRP